MTVHATIYIRLFGSPSFNQHVDQNGWNCSHSGMSGCPHDGDQSDLPYQNPRFDSIELPGCLPPSLLFNVKTAQLFTDLVIIVSCLAFPSAI